jgi:xanthine/CO dehydrogenase XdhC/CoxF family maturation factor
VLLRADDGRIAGSVSGGCVEGAAAEEIERARATAAPGHPLRDQRRGGVGRRARLRRNDRRARRAGSRRETSSTPREARRGGAAPSSRRSPPTRRPRSSARTSPGTGRHPRRARRPRRRPLDGTLGSRTRRALVGRGARRAPARHVADGRDRRPAAVHRGVPGSAAARRRRRGRGRAVARRLRARARLRDVVVDGRASFATPERFPDVDRLVVGWPDEVADEIGLGPNDAVAVLTHDVKFDEPAIVEALRRGCRYVGAVGSKKTQADRRARLLEAGVGEDELARLRGPIGLDLGGRNPARPRSRSCRGRRLASDMAA